MAEAFGFYAENLLTRDHFTEVLNARFSEFDARMERRFEERIGGLERTMDQRSSEQEAHFEQRFNEQNLRFVWLEKRLDAQDVRMDTLGVQLNRLEDSTRQLTRAFSQMQRAQFLHSWILGILAAAILIPQLSALMPTA